MKIFALGLMVSFSGVALAEGRCSVTLTGGSISHFVKDFKMDESARAFMIDAELTRLSSGEMLYISATPVSRGFRVNIGTRTPNVFPRPRPTFGLSSMAVAEKSGMHVLFLDYEQADNPDFTLAQTRCSRRTP